MSAAESVRMVIWDLDDTFWQGTLEEGNVRWNPRNAEVVKELSRRGIVNAIASKNNLARVQEFLEAQEIWSYFVFPQIAYEPKGAMVKAILEYSQLRAPSVLFIDDLPSNLHDVEFHNPGVQTASPEVIGSLLDDARLRGKSDPELSRLKQYQVLERKRFDRAKFADREHAFLKSSEVQLSIHYDVSENFERIFELVNRTNQLNFTKSRWPEDIVAARELFGEAMADRQRHVGYIRCRDKYGDHGICGFYMLKARKLEHFVFSCRIMNMGIEQLIFRLLRRPILDIVGDVVSDPKRPGTVDWISVVEDVIAGTDFVKPGKKIIVCMRGSCELDQMAHYLSRYDMRHEVTFPFRGWGIAVPLSQYIVLREEVACDGNHVLTDRLPGLHDRCLNGMVFDRSADAYVLSFGLEFQWGHYRYIKTGAIVPLRLQQGSHFMAADLTGVGWAELRDKSQVDMSESDWHWFQTAFEYVDHFQEERLAGNAMRLFDQLVDKKVVVVELNELFGKDAGQLQINAQINRAIRAAAAGRSVSFVPADQFVLSAADIVDELHFHRPVYMRMAQAVAAELAA